MTAVCAVTADQPGLSREIRRYIEPGPDPWPACAERAHTYLAP